MNQTRNEEAEYFAYEGEKLIVIAKNLTELAEKMTTEGYGDLADLMENEVCDKVKQSTCAKYQLTLQRFKNTLVVSSLVL